VPPPAVTVALPPTEHVGLVLDVILAVNAAGAVNVTFAVAVHPFASVTVTVYEPAAKPLAVVFVPPLGAHEYVKLPVPPLAVTVALPSVLVWHKGFVLELILADIAEGAVNVTLAVTVHPFASVTVTVYVPADKLFAVALVPPEGAHEYVYEPVPPPAVTVALPVVPPLHNGLVLEVIDAVNRAGSVKVVFADATQPLLSVTVAV